MEVEWDPLDIAFETWEIIFRNMVRSRLISVQGSERWSQGSIDFCIYFLIFAFGGGQSLISPCVFAYVF